MGYFLSRLRRSHDAWFAPPPELPLVFPSFRLDCRLSAVEVVAERIGQFPAAEVAELRVRLGGHLKDLQPLSSEFVASFERGAWRFEELLPVSGLQTGRGKFLLCPHV